METYAVDIDTSRGLIAHGGSTNCVEVYDYQAECPVYYVGEFSDSILYVKFLGDNRLLVVTVDGLISILDGASEVASINVEEAVSVARFDKNLLVGTEEGRVYLYDEELNLIATCTGHDSSLIAGYCHEDKIYSLSDHSLIIHDMYGNTVSTFRANMASSFCNISGEVFCLARDERAQVFKGTRKLFEINLEGSADAMTIVGTNLVLGGTFSQLILIDTLRHYGISRLDIGVEILECEALGTNEVIFSTVCGCIGLVDIRDIKTLRIYEVEVGTIYTFRVTTGFIVYGGEEGTGFINLSTGVIQKLDAFSTVD
ncbi:hypothetical protein PAEPH01_0365 [Pancytospora epiphaga]|nr:hypothetical protein PAEPH01_0365 [Pancytospora epiphaga]